MAALEDVQGSFAVPVECGVGERGQVVAVAEPGVGASAFEGGQSLGCGSAAFELAGDVV
ncbi:hypothetical protein [Mycobacterium sp. PSTR-4-N]|uniref:hypothetical protein n=1 Tax=Mycobacterium sp. PSTR-4-N TaxID=2917745 RepID=UPI001F156DC5|nr:hypothetical protein [Mycobacterium sp. PSTR-4-N]MCG7597841.1 hypothetical protein [Mycobacterium sp. PSTR-4-N]